jgi:FAD/FMN-containing dehydrogenase
MPPDPSSQLACTIGGNVAENSGGPHTLKYGTTTNHVLAVELVLPDGDCVRLGSPSGGAPGYDLLGAVVGSEGTLGIVTEVTVRLVEIPEAVETLLAIFPDTVSACRAVGRIIRSGLIPAALEIVDQRTIAAVEDSVYAAGMPRDAGAILIAELDGDSCALPAQVQRVRESASAEGATEVAVAADDADISFDRRDPDELRRVLAAGKEILEACVATGGVITGEHGVGSEKREFIHLVFGETDLDAMRRVRDSFNPDGLCNPEKIFPTTRFCAESNPKARGYDEVPFA